MFLPKRETEEKLTIDDLIDSTIVQMDDDGDSRSEDYTLMVKNLKTLLEAKALEKDSGVSADILAGIGANLLGILLVLNYERLYPVTSKAFSFLRMMR